MRSVDVCDENGVPVEQQVTESGNKNGVSYVNRKLKRPLSVGTATECGSRNDRITGGIGEYPLRKR